MAERRVPGRPTYIFYVMRTFTRPGWLFSVEIRGWLFEGCTLWRLRGRHCGGFGLGPFWIGRRP